MSASNLANMEVALGQGALVVRSMASSVLLTATDPYGSDADFLMTLRLGATVDLLQNRPAGWWRSSASLRSALIDDLVVVILPAVPSPPPPSPTPSTSGSASQTIRTVSVDYTVQADDHTILVNAAGGPVTITLPTCVGNAGRVLVIKKIDSSSNAVSVTPQPPDTVDGAVSYDISIQYESATLHCDGQSYYVI